MKTPRFNDDLILRYLAGTLHGEEAKIVRQYLSATPERRGALAGLQASLRAEDIAGPPPDLRLSVAQFLARLERLESSDAAAAHQGARTTMSPQGTSRARAWGRYIAATAMALLLSIVGVRYLPTWLTPGPSTTAQELREYTTHRGQRATVHLPDGSAVLLNNESRIRYAADFGTTSRTVVLDGEALFTIVRHSDVPFIVTTPNVSTRVLGTVFSVRHYPEDSTTRVVVAQGKVAAGQTLLTAGQSATSQADGTTTRDSHTDAATAFAWTTGQLSLPYVPLGDGIVRLERWFDIDVVLADRALASRHLNITLQDETPRQALALIAEAIGARVSWHGRTATLHPLPTDR